MLNLSVKHWQDAMEMLVNFADEQDQEGGNREYADLADKIIKKFSMAVPWEDWHKERLEDIGLYPEEEKSPMFKEKWKQKSVPDPLPPEWQEEMGQMGAEELRQYKQPALRGQMRNFIHEDEKHLLIKFDPTKDFVDAALQGGDDDK